MSARDALSNADLRGFLRTAGRRLNNLERRANWPASIHSDSLTLPGVAETSVQDVAAGDYPASGATTVCSLTLDPGRWHLVGRAVHELIGSPALAREVGLIMSWSGGASGQAITSSGNSSEGLVAFDNQMSVAQPVTAASELLVDLQVFAGVDSSAFFSEYLFYFGILIAFPG